MQRGNFLYMLVSFSLFGLFVHILDANRAEAKLNQPISKIDQLIQPWKITKAITHNGKDVSADYGDLKLQFLNNAGFISYKAEQVQNTGNFFLEQDYIRLELDEDPNQNWNTLWKIDSISDEHLLIHNQYLRVALIAAENL